MNVQTRVLGYASRPEAELVLFLAAAAEVVFLPVSADLLLIPMVLVNFDKAFRYAMIATAGAVVGGVGAFIFGAVAYNTIGVFAVERYQLAEEASFLRNVFAEYNVLLVLAAGLSTIPYKIMSVLSGVSGAGLPSFVVASVVARGGYFFLISWMLWRGGGRYKVWMDMYFQGLSMVMALGLLLVFVLLLLLVQGG